MPNIITHTLFAEEMLKDMPEWLQERHQLVKVGSNGPDFLFFKGMSPRGRFKKNYVNKVGSRLHHEKTNEFYASALESVRNEPNPVIQKDMEAYVIGHLFHWALDSVIHPYVFYRTGPCDKKTRQYHHRMESILDAIMLKVKKGITIRDYDISNLCDLTLDQTRAIARVYVPATAKLFDQGVAPHEIRQALEDWHKMQKVFYDPSGLKIAALHHLEKLVKKENVLSGYFVPNEPEDNYDVMNLLHKEWSHPSGTFVSTESVFDLYKKAMAKAARAAELFQEALEDPEKEGEFLRFLDNQSYDSGLSQPQPMEIFDICTFDF